MSPSDAAFSDFTQQGTDADIKAKGPLLVSVSISDLRVLQRCYMPFFRHGGLFVPSRRQYGLRQRVFLILTLPAPPGSLTADVTFAVNATVAWLTPAQAQGDFRMGFGLHFDPGAPDPKHAIESLLNALL